MTNLEPNEITKLAKTVLKRLANIDNETDPGTSSEQLIFPNKTQKDGIKDVTVNIKRISEQELRFLFVEEFKKTYSELFYSVETPTIKKYKFGKSYEDIRTIDSGQSALLDMCIFERNSDKKYKRILNIEFKHKNCSIEKIGKDICKLINEEGDGLFLHLLDNTDKGTLHNNGDTGVFDKLQKSFEDFKSDWIKEDKTIQVIILCLKQKELICKIIKKNDLDMLGKPNHNLFLNVQKENNNDRHRI